MNFLDILDLATRPIGVPLYLLAARWSVGAVEKRRRRAAGNGTAEGLLKSSSGSDLSDLSDPSDLSDLSDCPAVSIIVPALNAGQTIGRCLESIRSLDYPADRLDLIVADNGSTDRTAEIARQFEANVVVEPKRGAAAARNAAIRAATGEYVAMTDADCIVHPLWLKHLVAKIQEQAVKCAAVGGRIVNKCHDTVIGEFCEREGVLNQEAAVAGRLLPFPFVITANGLFRREALDRIGGFDEDFADAAAEDVDLGWRLGEQNGALVYAPKACVFHPQRERDVDIYAQFYRYGLSEAQLYLKHGHRFGERELTRHLWIRPLLYRHFWSAAWRWAGARNANRRRLWRLTMLKELGHMAGKMEGGRRWRTRRYFRLWTHE